jgi:hypothetical protein
MLRGPIKDNERAAIHAMLPDLDALLRAGGRCNPEWDSMVFHDAPGIPVAGVCLRDAISILGACRFALYEAYAHRTWHLRGGQADDRSQLRAAWAARFFGDDAVLRLYAVGEHLASAITYALSIDAVSLKSYRERRTSQQAVVGKYLAREHPNHPLTAATTSLSHSPAWLWTQEYRNKWVHEQPPGMEGLGIHFHRRPRWIENPAQGSKHLNVTISGDPPDCTGDELLTNATGALADVVAATKAIWEYYRQLLEDRGMGSDGRVVFGRGQGGS